MTNGTDCPCGCAPCDEPLPAPAPPKPDDHDAGVCTAFNENWRIIFAFVVGIVFVGKVRWVEGSLDFTRRENFLLLNHHSSRERSLASGDPDGRNTLLYCTISAPRRR